MGFRAIVRNELGEIRRRARPMPAPQMMPFARTRIIRERVEKSGVAVIPREPYPGDIGSHSPFLRIGDRTALDQRTNTHTRTRIHVYITCEEDQPKFKFPTGIRATLSTTCGKQPRRPKRARLASIIELYAVRIDTTKKK